MPILANICHKQLQYNSSTSRHLIIYCANITLLNQTKEKISWIIAQIRLDQISSLHYYYKFTLRWGNILLPLTELCLDRRVQFYPSMSYLHCVERLSVSDCHWQSLTHIYLIRGNCLSNRKEITREILFNSGHRLNRPGQLNKSFARQMTQLVTLVANNSQLRQLRENFEQNYSLQSQLSNSQFR